MARLFRRVSLHGSELQDKIDALRFFYLPMDLNTIYYGNKLIAVKQVALILKNTTNRSLQRADFTHLLLCSLTLLYYFAMQFKLRQLSPHKLFVWRQKRQFEKAENVFHKTMDYLQPDYTTIQLILDFFSKVSLWTYENFVVQILEVVLVYTTNRMALFNLLLSDINNVLLTEASSVRHRMRVLFELLKSDNWVLEDHNLIPFTSRLLDFYTYSIAKASDNVVLFKYLQRGYEMCLQSILERAENDSRLIIIITMLNWVSTIDMNEEDLLRFGSLLERGAQLYEVTSYGDSIGEELFIDVLQKFVGSSDGLYNLIGSRLLLRLLDRQSNATYLHTPVIYFDFSQVNLKVGSYVSGDKNFIRQLKENMHEYFLRACKNHCYNTDNLTILFSLICIIVLEVPCGLTAAFAAFLMLSIQDFAFNVENLPATYRYWLHAIVISVMSLISWVHKAPMLYSIVNAIMSKRAKEAPQLNPPLMTFYDIARHNITWNKPALFFEDWELRYGLWKDFKNPTKPVKRSRDQYMERKRKTMKIVL